MPESIIDIIELPSGDELAITIEWSPDPQMIEQMMLESADRFDDWSMPLEEARELMIASTKERFESETDPFGVPWVPLDPAYADYKESKGGGEKMLVWSGALKDAATGEENWIIAGHSVYFNTASLPRYAEVHQTGSGEDRKGLTRFRRIERSTPLKKQAKGYALDFESESDRQHFAGFSPDAGVGNSIPQRQYLGIDYAAFDKIEAIFIDFMDREVTDYIDWVAPIPGDFVTTTKGFSGTLTNIRAIGGGFMVRGAGGRFVKGVHHL